MNNNHNDLVTVEETDVEVYEANTPVYPKQNNKHKLVTFVILILSIVLLSRLSAPVLKPLEPSLNSKQTTTTELMAAATGASLAVSLLPGDTGTAISEQLADFGKYFMVIMGAIMIEKALLTAAGPIVFGWLVPAACVLYLLYLFRFGTFFKQLAIKLAIFALVLYAAIPASIFVSNQVDKSFNQSAQELTKQIKEETAQVKKQTDHISESSDNILDQIKDKVVDMASSVGEAFNEAKVSGESMLNKLTIEVTNMIITTCVIPIVTLLVFSGVTKVLFGFDMASFGRGIAMAHRRRMR